MSGSLEALRSTVSTQSVISPVGVEITASRRGAYRGETVRTTNENSKLSRASDEMRATTSQRIDLRSAQIRSIRQGQAANLLATGRIAEFYDKLPDMPGTDKLQSLANEFQAIMTQMPPPMHLTEHVGRMVAEQQTSVTRGDDRRSDPEETEDGDRTGQSGQTGSRTGDGLMGRGERPDPIAEARDRIMSQLQQFDGDVTHQFAALELMVEQFQSGDAPETFLQALDQVRQTFEQSDIARDVRAGFAIADIAHRSAATLETDPGLVRDGYRALLREQSNLGGLFDQLSRFDLSAKFEQVIETFLTAAGRDLASTDHSTDAGFLHGLIRELSKLKTMQTVLDQAKDLVRNTERLMTRSERGQLHATSLTSAMLHFAAKTSPTPRDARQLLGDGARLELQTQVVIGNGLRTLHSQVPDDVIPTPQSRLQQNSAIMSFLDQLVDEEERQHEGTS